MQTAQKLPQFPACNGVLVIDDEKDIRESLEEALKFEGYPVEIASNGQEGLKALAHLKLPQLILLDLMMPVMNGWSFAEAVSTNPTLSVCPIVVVSAFPEKGKSISVEGIVKKPIDLDEILMWVKKGFPSNPKDSDDGKESH